MSGRTEHAVGLYLEGIRDGRPREALDRHVGARYTQHSSGVADGRDGFLAFFEPFLARHPVREIEIVRTLEDGPYVFVHAAQTLDGDTRWVTTDLFDTDADGRVVEHWDTIAPGGQVSPSGHGQVDGPRTVTDLDRTAANKDLVAEFLAVVLTDGALHRAHHYLHPDLIEHGRRADGLHGFEQAVQAGPERYLKVHRLAGQGDLVVTLSEVDRSGRAWAVFDVFRLDGSMIVEHWENAEPVPSPEQAGNGGKF